jgi:predicted metal-binding membrane protein
VPCDPDSDEQPVRARALLEAALRHEKWVSAALLVGIPLAGWAWIAAMAEDMYGSMQGASAWMMTARWDPLHVALLFAMWAVMMIAMMLPSAAPLLLLYAGSLHGWGERHAGRRLYAMAGGYVAAWTAFSAAATWLQRLLGHALLLTPMMEPQSPMIAALLLAIAGAYQLTPQKLACLRRCRTPLSFLLQHWRPGIAGAFRLGLAHGLYCLGCCWALMLLLFAGGVMNLTVIVALTLWVLVEKFAPFGEWTARIGGVALLGLAAWVAL